jgi:hypothetical protein
VAGPLAPPANATPPARYVIPGDGTVHDPVTNLTWQQFVPISQQHGASLAGAASLCASLSLGPLTSAWRIPTLKELVSIMDMHALIAGVGGLFDPTAFPIEIPDAGGYQPNQACYWTSTPELVPPYATPGVAITCGVPPNDAWAGTILPSLTGPNGAITMRCVHGP